MQDGIAKSNIEYVTEEKDLGILIDSKLKFRAHVGTVVSKANQMVGIIKRSFDNMGEFPFLNLLIQGSFLCFLLLILDWSLFENTVI